MNEKNEYIQCLLLCKIMTSLSLRHDPLKSCPYIPFDEQRSEVVKSNGFVANYPPAAFFFQFGLYWAIKEPI